VVAAAAVAAVAAVAAAAAAAAAVATSYLHFQMDLDSEFAVAAVLDDF